MKSQNDGSLGRESRKEVIVNKRKKGHSIAFKIRAELRWIQNNLNFQLLSSCYLRSVQFLVQVLLNQSLENFL